MKTNNDKNVQRVIEAGMALVVIGVGLNALVTWTLGAFDAASVLLALYVGFWAYVLGTMALIVLSIWLVFMRKELVRPCMPLP